MEILFRGKHTPHWWDQEKKIWITYPTVWVYGHYYEDFDYGQGEKHKTHNIVDAEGNHYRVDLDTVSQFTNKLCQGERVFDGDIFKFDEREWGGKDNIHLVEWDEDEAAWSWGGGSTGDMGWREKIGNKWDNPELLK